MIPKETIDLIFETARIDEVVGDFVHLKKRGVNMLGNCPFHDEKTPSFTVSPAKGIYKCFGCGKGGNSVNFVMDHEHFSYPEALKFLASKYNIFIEEQERTPEQEEAANDRESMYIVSNSANEYFQDQLFNGDEGRAIGLSYFK
ncbi:MAG: DNA primase, partial [Flavobacteriales bacterium]